jgi:hypothetical protein
MKDFAKGGVLNWTTHKWISGSKSNYWFSEAAPQKSCLSTMCNLLWRSSDYNITIGNYNIWESSYAVI